MEQDYGIQEDPRQVKLVQQKEGNFDLQFNVSKKTLLSDIKLSNTFLQKKNSSPHLDTLKGLKKQLRDYPQIMVVDDVFFNIDILKYVLGKVLKVDCKKEVIEAYNGKQALDAFVKNRKKNKGKNTFKLILMDLDMPIMDGFEASKKILLKAKKKYMTKNGTIESI